MFHALTRRLRFVLKRFPLFTVLLALGLASCGAPALRVRHPLAEDISAARTLVVVQARPAPVQFLNPREKVRIRTKRLLKAALAEADIFGPLVHANPELTLSVTITEFSRAHGHADDATCELDVQLTEARSRRLLTHFVVRGRSANRASKGSWQATDTRAIEEAVHALIEYLAGRRLAARRR